MFTRISASRNGRDMRPRSARRGAGSRSITLARMRRIRWADNRDPRLGGSARTLKPVTSINDLTDPHGERLNGLSDDAVLAELASLDPLPDESDPGWHEEPFELFDEAGLFVALADQVGERRLTPGIGLLLDKACFGDPGEMMRGLRHALEAACDGNWSLLAETCAGRAGSVRPAPGCGRWPRLRFSAIRFSSKSFEVDSLMSSPT